MKSELLLQHLIEQSRTILNQAEKLKGLDKEVQTWRPDDTSWNILECIEHLNRYGDFYLPQIDIQIRNSTTHSESEFKSGLLGAYFAKSMLPKEDMLKMPAFKSKNPLGASVDVFVIEKFIHQQMQLLNLLNESRKVSLNKVKVKTTLSGWLTINLGDTFQFFIYHNLRHMKQTERLLEAMRNVGNS